MVATVLVATLCVSTLQGSVGAAQGQGQDAVAVAEAALDQARQIRCEAEQRLGVLQARRERVVADLRRLDEGAAVITDELAAARREVREFAVAAYIDGGQSEMLAATLNPRDNAAMVWRSRLLGGQTVDSADSVDRYSALQAANDPERVAAADQLDQLGSTIEQAFSDVLQAAALERDAEHALADALAAAKAEADAAARAAAKAEADAAAAARKTAAPAPAQKRPAPATPPTGAPAPAAIEGATEAEQAQLARIRHCESRGNYSAVSASGRYRGAYQFDYNTWAAIGGSGDPAAAPPAEQDARALQLLRQRGTRPWPNCA